MARRGLISRWELAEAADKERVVADASWHWLRKLGFVAHTASP